ncbi:PDR/VanB family oxidoreductase [Ideonella azotifigens]|nr:PDR/VanB family oxidoreductase [Ideonella azotifigens]MCD2341172.1 PDR/VanB family oxidoreductase [Ideonella azotifigens]
MGHTTDMLRVMVAARNVEAVDICSFELVDAGGGALPPFSAGSHVDVLIRDGLTRQYSLCNDPAESHRYRIAVLRDAQSRGGSKALHDGVRVGDSLTISLPKNHFALAHDAQRHLLLAGGIGITPVLCMAERLARIGAEFELHYATRSRERTSFIQHLAASSFAGRVHHYFGDSESRLVLTDLLAAPVGNTHLYVCGPKGFMDAVLTTARSAGWPEAALHHEFFGAALASSADDAGFQVKLASSGQVVWVPKEISVVAALAQVGVEIPTSCEQGVCGTCLTRVLAGEPDHKDLYLSPAEQAANDQFLPCCSRSRSEMLVLDL